MIGWYIAVVSGGLYAELWWRASKHCDAL